MYAAPALFDGPDWSDDKHRRIISFIAAAFLVAGLLSLFRLPQPDELVPIGDSRPKPIWENVETDDTGRLLLRHGDCYKILDDPNVGSREKFLTFGQFMVHCSGLSEKPRNLPWVDEVNARRGVPSQHGHPAAE